MRRMRFLVAKRVLVRFAEWAGWLTAVDRKVVAAFLSHQQ